MKKLLLAIASLTIGIQCYCQTPSQLFDVSKMEYKGSKTDQAKILLRKVLIGGDIEHKQPNIDFKFFSLLESKLNLNKDKIRQYINTCNLSEQSVGGSLNDKVSFTTIDNKKIYAKYFVIHDVSNPEFEKVFPLNINEDSWSFNNASKWTKAVTHIYVTRTGKLNAVTAFAEGLRATKFELKKIPTISKGLFLHIELIQPRVYPPGKSGSAQKGPTPGFTDIQYERLALLYICASVKKGEWLIPAFHANIDEGIPDGHDDPQNFEIDKFTKEVLKLSSLFQTN